MSRKFLFVLLLATGVVRTDELPETACVATTNATQPQMRKEMCVASASQVPGARCAPTAAKAQGQTEEEAKLISGMSVLGNQEAPKSLVIVPWKSSEIGDSLGFSTMLDDSRQPIDKEVFMRALSYYLVRSQTTDRR